MSITITFTNAPETTAACEWCADCREDARSARAAGEDYVRAWAPSFKGSDAGWVKDARTLSDDDIERLRCDFMCQGERTETDADCEMNLANGSMTHLDGMLRLSDWADEDSHGQWGLIPHDQLGELQQRITRRINGDLTPWVSDSSDEQGWVGPEMTTDEHGMPTIIPARKTARVISQGYSEGRLDGYLGRLQVIVAKAASAGSPVHWG